MNDTKTLSSRRLSMLLALGATFCIASLAPRAAHSQQAVPEVNSDLGGDDRYLLHVSTDKPVYRPGETVFVRGALLHAFTHAPAPDAQAPQIKITSPRGDAVATGYGTLAEGSMSYVWAIPPGLAGGEYKVVATTPAQGYPPAERTFRINAYRVPRLRTDLQFARKAYGPGDEVRANLTATRSEGGLPAGAPVEVVAIVDGREVHRAHLALDTAGALSVAFTLPREIESGDGTLSMAIRDGGVLESAVKSIPIVVTAVKVDLYPEGGDLVAGLPSRLYVEARTPKGLPADLSGRILDSAKQAVATLRTEHEGRGRVTFTPAAGHSYSLVVDQPAGVKAPIALPAVASEGFTLAASQDVFEAGDAVKLTLGSTASTRVRLALSQREREIASTDVDLQAAAPHEVTLTPPSTTSGVLRATLIDAKGRPRAERLIFRRAAQRLTISLKTDAKHSEPGGKVKVTVRCLDERERPVKATVGLSVVDDALLQTIDKRDRAPRLVEQAFLESEVTELAEPAIYLAPGAESARDLDLLMGTQGWRRFALVDPSAFLGKYADRARRALALREPPAPSPETGFAEGGPVGAVPEEDGMMLKAMAAPRPQAPAAALRDQHEAQQAVRALAVDKLDRKAEEERGAPEIVPAPQAVPADEEDAARVGKPMPAAAPDLDRRGMAMASPVPMGEPAPANAQGAPMPAFQLVAPMAFARARRQRWGRLGQPIAPMQVVRVYAHQSEPGRSSAQRNDFTETVYWNAGLATDEKGEASFEFALSDSVTTFRVMADAFSHAGALGEADATIESRRPFYVEAKLPLEVTAGDRIDVPVALINGTEGPLSARLAPDLGEGLTLASHGESSIDLAGDARGRIYLPIVVGSTRAPVPVRIKAVAGGEVAALSRALPTYADDVTRILPVVPAGFPIELSFGGKLEGKVEHAVSIPKSIDPASLTAQATVYPSPAASLTQAVEALLAQPGGCFEQTSSANYPNIMALWYFKSHRVDDARLVERASHLLDDGYKRLVGFECKQKGYEWFGGDPGHEALTAYGVLEFTDMAKVYPVDPDMLTRTRDWLLSRRDGHGGFQRNPRALDSFGHAPQEITDAYITWALTEAGQTDLVPEIEHVYSSAAASEDPYLVALAANTLATRKDPRASELMRKLGSHQQQDGSIAGASTSITGSSGDALAIETTALAVLAWLKSSTDTASSERAADWLLTRCKGGRFGSTQSTILALKAIIAYDEAHARPAKAGSALLWIDGKVIEESSFQADKQGPITFPKFTDRLTPGDHTIGLSMVGGAPMPYSISVRYYALTPASSPACKVGLKAVLGRATVAEGETVDLDVTVKNRTSAGLPMVVAIIGLPAGLEARTEQLKELVGSGQIDFFETRARQVILYWRQMAPSAAKSLVINLVAAIPGKFTGPASCAYLYYTDEQKDWADGLVTEVSHR